MMHQKLFIHWLLLCLCVSLYAQKNQWLSDKELRVLSWEERSIYTDSILQAQNSDDPDYWESMRSLAHLYHNAEKCDKATLLYQRLISAYAGNTRHGAESRFFSGQCALLQKQYGQTIALWKSIRATTFLPLAPGGLNEALARVSYLYLQNEYALLTQTQRDSAITSLLAIPIGKPYIDSMYMGIAEIAVNAKDTSRACPLWNLAIHSASDFQDDAIYNYATSRCPTTSTHANIEVTAFYKWLLKEKKRPLSQRLVVFHYLLRDAHWKDSVSHLPNLLAALPFSELPSIHQSEIGKYLLRTSPNQTMLQSLCKEMQTGHSLAVFNLLIPKEITLYNIYGNQEKIRSIAIPSAFSLDQWESALRYYLTGLKEMDALFIVLKSGSTTPIMLHDSTLVKHLIPLEEQFYQLGQTHTEWIFEAAPLLQETYLSLLEQIPKIPLKSEKTQLGNLFVEASIFQHAYALESTIYTWKDSLQLSSNFKSQSLDHLLLRTTIFNKALNTKWKLFYQRLHTTLQKIKQNDVLSYPEFWSECVGRWNQWTSLPHEESIIINKQLIAIKNQTSQLDSLNN